MSVTTKLTPKQDEVLEFLPASVSEIARAFDISQSTVRDHLSNIRKNVELEKREGSDGEIIYVEKPSMRDRDGTESTDSPQELASKQAITKEANRYLFTLERRLHNLLEDTDPLTVDNYGFSGREDVVIHRTDDHIGDVVKNEYGEETFNVDIAKDRVRGVTKKSLQLVERQEAAGYEFDVAHLLLGGDLVTGENIYNHQPHMIEITLDEQIDVSVELYLEQIKALAERFKAVQVVCQIGNHGELRGSGLSEAMNCDRVVYMMLDKILRESEYENIEFIRNYSTKFTNFRIRGHRAHLRHGHNALPHIGTSASKKKWRGWKLDHAFDVAYWGHYHSMEIDEVHGAPVIRSGSIKPGGDYEEGLSESGSPAATIHGVSDERPVTWIFPVDFNER